MWNTHAIITAESYSLFVWKMIIFHLLYNLSYFQLLYKDSSSKKKATYRIKKKKKDTGKSPKLFLHFFSDQTSHSHGKKYFELAKEAIYWKWYLLNLCGRTQQKRLRWIWVLSNWHGRLGRPTSKGNICIEQLTLLFKTGLGNKASCVASILKAFFSGLLKL